MINYDILMIRNYNGSLKLKNKKIKKNVQINVKYNVTCTQLNF